jgi:homopolymeric O-antigen transport system ATP-binding protein
MSQPILSVESLDKIYKIYPRPLDRVREMVTRRPCHQEVRALEGIAFELQQGESLGIIGQNGSGKSTLLKILSGVTVPTRGEVAVRGQVASLLELGMGFHFEFTGRQNIAINAAIMGLSPQEVARRSPEIIAFSELGEFIDRPVKTYSTGMKMRLGFSIAINVEPEILIVDEALSVGDGYFQKKCMDRILGYLDSGRTLLFCSHAMYYVSTLCQRAMWLRHGRVAALGPVEEVVREYERFLLAKSRHSAAADAAAAAGDVPAAATENAPAVAEDGGKPARIVAVRQAGGTGTPPRFRFGEPWELEIEWVTGNPEIEFHVAVGIDRIDGVQICACGSHRDRLPAWSGSHRYRVRLRLPEMPVLKGEFSIYVFLMDEDGVHVFDQWVLRSAFSIAPQEEYVFGLIRAEHSWDTLVRDAGPADPASADTVSADTVSADTVSADTVSADTVSAGAVLAGG